MVLLETIQLGCRVILGKTKYVILYFYIDLIRNNYFWKSLITRTNNLHLQDFEDDFHKWYPLKQSGESHIIGMFHGFSWLGF